MAVGEPLFRLYGNAACIHDSRLRSQAAFGPERTMSRARGCRRRHQGAFASNQRPYYGCLCYLQSFSMPRKSMTGWPQVGPPWLSVLLPECPECCNDGHIGVLVTRLEHMPQVILDPRCVNCVEV